MTGAEFKKLYLSKHTPKDCKKVLGISHMSLYRFFKSKRVDQIYVDKLTVEHRAEESNTEIFYLKEKVKDLQMIIETQALLIKRLSK